MGTLHRGLRSIRGRTEIPADMLPIEVAEESELFLQRRNPLEISIHEEGEALREDSPCMRTVSAETLRRMDSEHMRIHRENRRILGPVSIPFPLTPQLSDYKDASFCSPYSGRVGEEDVSDLEPPYEPDNDAEEVY